MTFTLRNAKQTGAAVVRVTLSHVPISSSQTGVNDALNHLNWTLTGTSDVVVEAVRAVSADPFTYDLVLNDPLTAGDWHLRAGDIRTTAGLTIKDQIVDFQAVNAQEFFTDPRDQLTSEDELRQNLNAALDGPGWRAWTAAIGYSLEQTRKTAKDAFHMKWLKSSLGVYLERNAGSYGLDKPPDVGFGDDVFRQLAMSLNANKVNRTALEAVLLAFYGIDGTQAFAEASLAEPYALALGDKLFFEVDGMLVDVEFSTTAAFTNIGAAKAIEVAAVINRRLALLELRALATASYNPTTGNTHLRIYSGIAGLRGRVRFYGGRAWDALRFPATLATTQTVGTQWEYRLSSSTNGIPEGRARLIWIGGADPGLGLVSAGHYVNIWGSPFQAVNRGYAEVLDSTSTYVEFAAPLGAVNQGSVTQIGDRDVFFINPTLSTLHDTIGAYVSQASPELTEVFLPATSSAVTRNADNAWYLNGEVSIPLDTGYAAARAAGSNTVTIKTATPHGLTAGRYFWLDDVSIDYTASLGAVQESYGVSPNKQRCYSATKLADGRVMACFSDLADATHNYYIFDPSTNTWSAGAATPFTGAGGAPALVTLSDGSVMGIGTTDWSFFAPGALSWTALAPLPFSGATAVPYRNAVLLKDGRVFTVGAQAGAFQSSVFNPATQTWTAPTDIDVGRVTNNLDTCAIVTKSGDVVVAGGGDGAGANAQPLAYLYNYPANTWSKLPDMPSAVARTVGVFVPRGPSGQVWIGGPPSVGVQVLDIASRTWTYKPYVSLTNEMDLVEHLGQVYAIPGASVQTWELLDSQSPGLATRALTNTSGPGVSGPAATVWGFRLDDGRILATTQMSARNSLTVAYMPFGEARTRSGGHLCGAHKVVSVIDPTTLTFETPNSDAYTRITGGNLTPVLAEEGELASGYLLDTKSGVALTEVSTTLGVALNAGTVPNVCTVADASEFPNEFGFLVLDFGKSTQVVLRSIGTASATQLRLAPGQMLERTYGVGTTVDLLFGNGPWAPATGVGLTATYLTGSAAGRIEADNKLDFAKATGTPMVTRVVYPGDRGLGNEGQSTTGPGKITDAVAVWGGDDLDAELLAAHEDEDA